MIIVIPCAGYGTRLQDSVGNVHKSLVDISGKPLLSRIVQNLRGLNPEKIVIITNDKFFDQFREWKNDHSEDVVLINDGTRSNDERLGTLRDVLLGLEDYEGEFAVYLGDNLLIGDLSAALNRFQELERNVIMLHDVKDLDSARRFGVVKIDNHHRISHMEEKPEKPQSTLISTGIYFLRPEIKHLMKKYLEQGKNGEGFGFFIGHTYQDLEYYGIILDETFRWIDIGSPESLEMARKLVPQG